MNTLKRILSRQYIQIARKGIWFYVALAINIILLYTYQYVMKQYWEHFIVSWKGKQQLLYTNTMLIIALIYNPILVAIYLIIEKISFFDKYRIEKDHKVWSTYTSQFYWRSIKFNIFNLLLLSPTLIYLQSFIMPTVNFSEKVPSIQQVIYQILFCILFQCSAFHFLHKWSHKYFYQFHKVHHEFKVTDVLTSGHFHPIDYIICNLIPVIIGPQILGQKMHFTTFIMWILWRIHQGYQSHCNYEFPWSIIRILPFTSSAQYHEFHHTLNQGNYDSTSALIDQLLNENSQYWQKFIKQYKKLKTN